MRANPNNDWLECARWMDNLNCLPLILRERLHSNQLQLNEFASSLRDGEILCKMLNMIIPGCIDSSLINKRAQMSQLLCLNNIRLFLDVCKSPQYFNLPESDLFDEHLLYDLGDFACVIRTLSLISRSSLIKETIHYQGFSLASENERSNSISRRPSQSSITSKMPSSNSFDLQDKNNDDIYYNIVPPEAETVESYYTHESFIINGLMDIQVNDNNAYQTIVTGPSHQQQHQPLKRDFVMREILNTEENFLDGLNTLMNDFLTPLSKVLNEVDRQIIFANIDKLIDLHKALYLDLYNACKGGQGRTQRICTVFESFKVDLMKEYVIYFSSLDRSVSKCDSLAQVALNSVDQSKQQYLIEFRSKLEECRKASKRGNFKITDLIKLPYQRVLKYHLLFSELLKQTDVDHSALDIIKKTKDSLCELNNYLNECQRDKENMSKIEQVLKHMNINSASDSSSSGSRDSSAVYSTSINLNLLKDFGHYIKDDKFRIKSIDLGERYARTRSFFLFEKALIICKSKGNSYNYKETLLINEYSIEDYQSTGSLTSQSSTNLPLGRISNLNLLNSSLTSSSINLSSSSNALSLHLVNVDHSKKYSITFKNSEQKKLWKESLLKAKEKIKPDGQRAHKHFFELTNFDQELVKCFVCNKYLLGIFYQGYKCNLCHSIAHKECLTKITTVCSAVNQPPPVLKPTRSMSLLRPLLPNQPSQIAQFYAKAVYRYDGRPPPPPEYTPLYFNQGDMILVIDDDDDDWWRGLVTSKTKQTKEEGYFPRRHVRVIQNFPPQPQIISTINLEEYPWFSPVDRSKADLILNRIPNEPMETIFMVRCRTEGGFAISIKNNGTVDHIKINICDYSPLTAHLIIWSDPSEKNEQTLVYSIDQQHSFNSIISLVNYYSQNLLKDNFPQLDTTLGTPFKLALPCPISVALAMHDYNPSSNPNNTGEQIELRKTKKYFVLNKEKNGWWRVYNSEGLIGYVPGSYLNEIRDQAES